MSEKGSIWTITAAQLRWFIGMTIVLTVAGMAWWAYYWLYYMCANYPNHLMAAMYCGVDEAYSYYGYEVFFLRLGSIAPASAFLSATLLSIWSLVRWICRPVPRIGRYLLAGIGLAAAVVVALMVFGLSRQLEDKTLTIIGPSVVDGSGYTWTATVTDLEPLFSKVQFSWFLDANADGEVQESERVSHSSIIADASGQAVDNFRWDFDNGSPYLGKTNRLAVAVYIFNPGAEEREHLIEWMLVEVLKE